MPIYPFECSNCKHQFNEFYHVTEDIDEVCPVCKERAVKKCIGLFSEWIAPHPAIFTGKYPPTPSEKKDVWQNGKSTKYY